MQRNKVSALAEAIGRGHDDVVDLLLADERVDVAQLSQDADPVTPFALACRLNSLGVVKAMLASGRVDVKVWVTMVWLCLAAGWLTPYFCRAK